MLVAMALCSPVMAPIYARWGARLVLAFGSAAAAPGLWLLAGAEGPVSYFSAWAILGLAGAAALTTSAQVFLTEIAGERARRAIGAQMLAMKVYTEVCSACHSMELVSFRTLENLGYSEAQVKAFAANYEVEDGPNADGEMFTRRAVPSDYFPSPFPNKEAAAASNNGAAPPDFSLIAKARGIERGFPQFVFDMFWPYQEGGPDYIHAYGARPGEAA